MNSLKFALMRTSGFLVAMLGRLSMTAAGLIVAAQACALIAHVERNKILYGLIQAERGAEAPAVAGLHRLAAFRVHGYDTAPLALAGFLILTWILCESQMYRLRVASASILDDDKIAEHERELARRREKAGKDLAEKDREQLLELYAQTKKSLDDLKQHLTFLSVDVVDSTGMKQGEDPALAERDFRHYKKLVEKVIADHKGLKPPGPRTGP
jgi:hypothetical protein